MHDCVREWMYISVCICMWVLVVYMYVYSAYMCTSVYQCVCIFLFMWVHVFGCVLQRFEPNCAIQTQCSQSADTPGDSKTNTRNDSEIRTGSCSVDQTAIRTRNHIISCECLFLSCYSFIIVNECFLYLFILIGQVNLSFQVSIYYVVYLAIFVIS